MSGESRLGATRMERVKERILDGYLEMVDIVVDALLAEGKPAFQRKLTEPEIMQRLIGWRDSMDDRYWGDVRAQAVLRRLQTKYGSALPGIGEQTPPQPAAPTSEMAALEAAPMMAIPAAPLGGL